MPQILAATDPCPALCVVWNVTRQGPLRSRPIRGLRHSFRWRGRISDSSHRTRTSPFRFRTTARFEVVHHQTCQKHFSNNNRTTDGRPLCFVCKHRRRILPAHQLWQPGHHSPRNHPRLTRTMAAARTHSAGTGSDATRSAMPQAEGQSLDRMAGRSTGSALPRASRNGEIAFVAGGASQAGRPPTSTTVLLPAGETQAPRRPAGYSIS